MVFLAEADLLRFTRKRNLAPGLRQNTPTGKSLLIFRNSSQARESKIFRFTRRANHHYKLAPSHPMRGAARDRHERAVGCGGREACERRAQAVRTAKPCGPGAPTLASSSQEAKFSRAMVARKPGHQGERGVSCKPLRREGRIASAEPVCSCAFPFVHFAHETAGAARTRSSLRLFVFEGGGQRIARAPRAAAMRRRVPSGFGS